MILIHLMCNMLLFHLMCNMLLIHLRRTFITICLLLPLQCRLRTAVCRPSRGEDDSYHRILIYLGRCICTTKEGGRLLGLQPGAPHLSSSSSFSWLERTVSVCGSDADFHQSCGVGLTDNQVRLISYILKSVT